MGEPHGRFGTNVEKGRIRRTIAYLNAKCSQHRSSPSPALRRGMTSKSKAIENSSVRSSVHFLNASDTSAYCNVAPIYDTPLRRLALCPRCRCAAIEPYSGHEDPPLAVQPRRSGQTAVAPPGPVTMVCGVGVDLTLYSGFEHVILTECCEPRCPSRRWICAGIRETVGCLSRRACDPLEHVRTSHCHGQSPVIAYFSQTDRHDLNLVIVLSPAAMIVDVELTGLMLPPIYIKTTHILPRPADSTSHVDSIIPQAMTRDLVFAHRPRSVLL